MVVNEIESPLIKDTYSHRSAIIEREYHQDSSKLSCIGDAIVQTSNRNKTGVLHNVLSVSNIHGFVKQSEQFEDRNIASEDTSNYKIVERNEFAFNPARINVGSIARLMTYENGIVSPMYICFRTKDCLQPEYLEYFFETKQFVFEMKRRLEGSVRQCLSFDGLCNIPFIIPIMEQQQRIEQHISVLTQKIQLENDILRLLHEQKSGLLNQMFI